MRVPHLDPVRRYAYTTRQAIHALQIAVGTWYRYTRLLGLRGQRRNGSNAVWWTYEQVALIFQAMAQEKIKRGRVI
jgi:hypothetical protein